MDDGINLVSPQQPSNQVMVTDITLDEFRRMGHCRAKPGREIIDNEDVLADHRTAEAPYGCR